MLKWFAASAFAVAFVSAVTAVPAPDLKPRPAAEVHAVGVYEAQGGQPLVARKGGNRKGTITVKVKAGSGPVVLVLTSYEPVTWAIEAPKGAVQRVVLSGYYRQEVTGLPAGVKVDSSSIAEGDKDAFYAYRQPEEFENNATVDQEAKAAYYKLLARVKEITGKDLSSLQGTYAGSTFEVP